MAGPSPNVIAGSIAATAAGIGRVTTVNLFTAAEMDEAAADLPSYRARGN